MTANSSCTEWLFKKCAMRATPARNTLVSGGRARIMGCGERKVEPPSGARTDVGVRADPPAGHAAAEFQRRLCAGVLRGCLFPATTGRLAAARHPAGHGYPAEPVLL